jgi:hypothetical protein
MPADAAANDAANDAADDGEVAAIRHAIVPAMSVATCR